MLVVELYHNHPVLKAFVLILQDEVQHTKHSHCGKPTVSAQINMGFSSGNQIKSNKIKCGISDQKNWRAKSYHPLEVSIET